MCRTTFTITNGITAIYWLHGTFFCMGAIVYAHTDVDFINKLLSYSVFNVTGNEVAEERVYIRRQPGMKQSISKLTLRWKNKGLSTGALK